MACTCRGNGELEAEQRKLPRTRRRGKGAEQTRLRDSGVDGTRSRCVCVDLRGPEGGKKENLKKS